MSILAARSNPISQRVMKPLTLDVFTAAREHMRHVFATYDRVVVSYSGAEGQPQAQGAAPIRVWSNLQSLRLESGDIAQAIEAFKANGFTPTAIGLHPKNAARFSKEAEALGLPVVFVGGCLLWEVWGYSEPLGVKSVGENNECAEGAGGGESLGAVGDDLRAIMSPSTATKVEGDIIRARGKRGPKPRQLPEEAIKRWAGEGMGSKAIAVTLRREHGIVVSYKTIQRLLKSK